MTHRLLSLILLLAVVCGVQAATPIVNLTPAPRDMQMGEGQFSLPQRISIDVAGVPDSVRHEAERLQQVLSKSTGRKVTLVEGKKGASIRLAMDPALGWEAYRMEVTPSQVVLTASGSTGMFYAMQSLKKVLPANVMAEVRGEKGTAYVIPCMTVDDAPRFWYRGFMLDCGRHFFTIDEIKHILDGMAMYKLNYFHWHLSEDQGWRFEVKKYPRLTQVGSVTPKVRWTDMEQGTRWIEEPYGPYYYTQEQCRDIVEYARQLHIQVIPEIDMPGHFTAAMASYPEFSCTPDGEHHVWTNQGGISSDVLNVGDERAVRFAQDILQEVMDVFPGEFVHIGGDECPSSAWERNVQCQAQLHNLCAQGVLSDTTSYRPLQSYFIHRMGQMVKSHGRRLILWNESITAKGADLDLIKGTDAIVFCWNPCQPGALKAAQMGLDCVITEWGPGCYYINRKQSDAPGEPDAAGYGGKGDQLPGVYAYKPVPDNVPADLRHHYAGVQATFWTEWVCDIHYADYLAYPRLLAVAEAGWSPQEKKDWDNFLSRCKADTRLLELTGRLYGKHFLE